MPQLRSSTLPAALALLVSGVALWKADLWSGGSLLLRTGAAAAWLTLLGGLIWLALRAAVRHAEEARQRLNGLCHMSLDDLSAAATSDDWPRLPHDNPFSPVLDGLRSLLIEAQQRVSEAQHQRSALEIRTRRQEAQLERMAAVVASLPEPVLVVDSYDQVQLANTAARKLFRLESDPVEQRVLSDLVRCEKLLALLQDTRKRKTAVVRSEEAPLPGPDGREHWYAITASPLAREPAAHGDASGTVVVLRDISHQKCIQKRNAEFLSAVSHEMKAPLAGIKAYVEMLTDGEAEDPQTREEFLGVIDSQAERLRRLIDNLLNLARIESGVVAVHKAPCSLNELLEEAFSVVRPAAEEKQVELVLDLSPMYLNVLVDRDQILQAAINLLSNAVKYTHSGGKVTLRSRLQDRHAQFDVEDTGVGLSPEDCDKIFERFYRVQKDRQMAPGTGLGLPLAKYIVEDVNGGRLTLQSQLGVGSTFTVSLPCAGKDD